MAPKGGGSGGGGGGGGGSSSSSGGGGRASSAKGSKGDNAADAASGMTSGASLSQETSRAFMILVVVPILWYLLEEGRMGEVMRWGVEKIIGGLKSETGGREVSDGKDNHDENSVAEMNELAWSMEKVTEEVEEQQGPEDEQEKGERGAEAEMREKGFITSS
ncbi:MAG: hypothetical protein Q9166_000470 [cf. Caloplaca sp. 2 TL-2023]